MLRLTLTQMRRSTARLVAAGIAIVISTAFVALTLLAGNAMADTVTAQLAARHGDADLVVLSESALTDAEVAEVTALPGVSYAAGTTESGYLVTEPGDGGRATYVTAIPTVAPALMPLTVVDGAMPSARGEIALPESTATRLSVGVGGRITLMRGVATAVDPAERHTPDDYAGSSFATNEDGFVTVVWKDVAETMTVTGTLADPHGAFADRGGAAVLTPADMNAWDADAQEPGIPFTPRFSDIAVALAQGADVEQARAEISDAVASSAGVSEEAVTVYTQREYAEARAAGLTGGQNIVFTVFGLVFAGIALIVAGLVITNTFQVLVAQRTRQLALLRCIGASSGALRRSVLLEAFVLGLLASLVGVLLGSVIGQAVLSIVHATGGTLSLPATIHVTASVIVWPVVLGTVVTVVAALAPAAAATRVAPLAALRPADAPSVTQRAGKVRIVIAIALVVVGVTLLVAGMRDVTSGGDANRGLLAAVAGGGLSFVGVVVAAVFWLPPVAGLAGRLVGLSGPTARLAAANTVRNPRRTAATASALLIGVTLVTTMATGAASARATMTTELDSRFPVDVVVTTEGMSVGADGSDNPVPASVTAAAESTEGVRDVVGLPSAMIQIVSATADTETTETFRAVDPATADGVLHGSDALDALEPGTVLVFDAWAARNDIAEGDTVRVVGPSGALNLTVALSPLQVSPLVVPADLALLATDAPVTTLWVGLEEDADVIAAAGNLQDAISDTGEAVAVEGSAVERAALSDIIDTMLAIVVGLLAASVVIALIGVANTLSLSVIERRKESATLRAIGLSRGRLRAMLAVEGVLIALVGAVAGVAIGLGYGWAGAQTILGWAGSPVLAFPTREIVIALVVAVAAGLVASIVPGRTAARTSPVEALATE